MDDEYIDRVLSGDTHAFRYFASCYQDMAFNVAVSIVKDDHYAEEVVQDAFMKAFKGLKSFNRTAKFKSWFYRIVVNESFQKLKKMKRENFVLDLSGMPGELDVESEVASKNHKSEQMIKAMRSLPSNETLALNLFYLEEYSLKEIESITGWTIANLKVILHRARKNLRTKLVSK